MEEKTSIKGTTVPCSPSNPSSLKGSLANTNERPVPESIMSPKGNQYVHDVVALPPIKSKSFRAYVAVMRYI